jgi:hypothetical protein
MTRSIAEAARTVLLTAAPAAKVRTARERVEAGESAGEPEASATAEQTPE